MRFAGTPHATNAEMGVKELRTHCRVDGQSEALLKDAVERMKLSARSYHHILKVARTIADLAGMEQIAPYHIAEAIQYRRREEV